MERLVMYASSDSGAKFCMGSAWERVKKGLHGKVDYVYFNVRSKAEIRQKVIDCLSGKACPAGGGHLCLK